MKNCPYCAEQIQDDAIKCRFCDEFLDPNIRGSNQKNKQPWFFKTSSIIGAFCVTGPFALPLVWLRKDTTLKSKIISTIVMLIITALLVWGMIICISLILDYYGQAFEF